MRAITVSLVKEIVPVIDTAIYASGDQLGALNEVTDCLFGGRTSAVLQSVCVVDKAKQKSKMTLLFFRSRPTVASANNAPLDIVDAQMNKCIGSVTINPSDYVDIVGSSVATVSGVSLVLQNIETDISQKSTSLWVIALVQGTPTYAAVTDIVLQLGLMQD